MLEQNINVPQGDLPSLPKRKHKHKEVLSGSIGTGSGSGLTNLLIFSCVVIFLLGMYFIYKELIDFREDSEVQIMSINRRLELLEKERDAYKMEGKQVVVDSKMLKPDSFPGLGIINIRNPTSVTSVPLITPLLTPTKGDTYMDMGDETDDGVYSDDEDDEDDEDNEDDEEGDLGEEEEAVDVKHKVRFYTVKSDESK